MAEIKVSALKDGKFNLEIKDIQLELTGDEAIELWDKLYRSINGLHVHNIPQIYMGPDAHTQQIHQSGPYSPGMHERQIPQPVSEYHWSALTKSIAKMYKRNDFFRDMSRVLGEQDGETIAQEILDLIDLATKG